MQRLEVSGAVRLLYKSLGFKGLTKNFCVLHNTVEHNYISSSSTLGLQLHVSAVYVWAIFRL